MRFGEQTGTWEALHLATLEARPYGGRRKLVRREGAERLIEVGCEMLLEGALASEISIASVLKRHNDQTTDPEDRIKMGNVYYRMWSFPRDILTDIACESLCRASSELGTALGEIAEAAPGDPLRSAANLFVDSSPAALRTRRAWDTHGQVRVEHQSEQALLDLAAEAALEHIGTGMDQIRRSMGIEVPVTSWQTDFVARIALSQVSGNATEKPDNVVQRAKLLEAALGQALTD